MQADGSLSQIGTAASLDAKPLPNSTSIVFVGTDYRAYQMDAAGAVTPFSDALNSSAYGAILRGALVDQQGRVLFTGQQTVLDASNAWVPTGVVVRVDPTTRQILDVPLPRAHGLPQFLLPFGNGFLLSGSFGLHKFDSEWISERWVFDGVSEMTQMPNGQLVIHRQGGLYVSQAAQPDNGLLSILDASLLKSTSALTAGVGVDSQNNLELAFQLMGLGKLRSYFQAVEPNGANLSSVNAAIASVSGTLSSRQLSDGGWSWHQAWVGWGSDSMVTAMVGVALDVNNPSAQSPQVRNAVQLLLSRQQPDGGWRTENGATFGLLGDNPNLQLIPSTWVEIWLPVMLDRLGGIDAQLQVTVPANVTLSNPDLPLISSVVQPDGSTLHTWNLVGVTSAGQKVNFDLSLQNMQIGEVRPVALSANLVMNNSLTGGTVTAPITVPVVSVDNGLSLTVTTDKSSYTESDQATFTATLTSHATTPQSAQLCQQWACITGKLDFSVNNQTARQVPLLGTIQGSRTVFNNCPAQIKDIPVTSSWVNRRSGAQVQNLWDNLTIPGNSNNVRLNGWQADSQQQANDIIDVLLTANWQNQTLFLARDQFQVVVLPPVLAGSVSINPTHAKAGQNVTIARTVKNSGAMGNNIPVSIRVTDTTQGGKLLQQFDQTLTLNPGETNNGNTNWQVSGTGGDQVKVELLATINGVVQVLGSTNFTIDK